MKLSRLRLYLVVLQASSLVALMLLTACGRKDSGGGGDETDAVGVVDESSEGGSVKSFEINATSKDPNVWTYFDLEASQVMEGGGGNDWDLGFQRFKIKSNGGVSGNAGVKVAVLDVGFADVTAVPADGYLEDQADGGDEDADPDYVFLQNGGWYDYDAETHKLSPKNRVYVVQTHAGNQFRVRITGYYNAAGTPAFLGLEWSQLPKEENTP